MTAIKLLMGLGNPGSRYANTRHNVGYWWLEQFCNKYACSLSANKKFNGQIGQTTVNQQKISCMTSNSYMNESGNSLRLAAQYFSILPEEILVIHDDLDIAVGNIKLKTSGGHGGHNGLRDIISKLGSSNFNRLRIGIGHPGDPKLVSNYVLQAPNQADYQAITNSIEQSFNIIDKILTGNWQDAMQYLHSLNNDINLKTNN